MTTEHADTALERARLDLGLTKRKLAQAAGVDEDTVAKYLRVGEGAKIGQVRRALLAEAERQGASVDLDGNSEDARPLSATSTDGDLIEFEISGNFGISLVVRAPVNDREAAEESVLRLIRSMNEKQD